MENVKQSLEKYGLKRHQSVGKKVGNQVWIHIKYMEKCDFIDSKTIKKYLKEINYNVNILRVNLKENKIALIESPDFDISNEPKVGRSALYENGELKKVTNPPANPLVYHHKWMFVEDDYDAFDTEASKRRSIEWKILLGTNRSLSSRIGRFDFWKKWLVENGLSQ